MERGGKKAYQLAEMQALSEPVYLLNSNADSLREDLYATENDGSQRSGAVEYPVEIGALEMNRLH